MKCRYCGQEMVTEDKPMSLNPDEDREETLIPLWVCPNRSCPGKRRERGN